jgi:dUTPase
VPALSAGGFDLYQPSEVVVGPGLAHVLDQQVQCHMLWRPAGAGAVEHLVVEHLVSYYLYPRSSTGLNTPLRLSNSVGIIDAGYRGSIKALFDNFSADFTVQKQQRLVQVCPPNLTYPLLVEVVFDVTALGTTARGMGGLGSTGI